METTAFSARVRQEANQAVIDMHGDIDGSAEHELYDAYREAEKEGTSRIVLNFSEVEYINSTGIALIVGLLAQARKSRRGLAVFGLNSHYVEIFQITRLADFMTIYPSEESALATS